MRSRLALLLLLCACGTPRAQPQVATVEEASLDARVVRADAAIDGAVDAPADAAIDAPAVATADADPPQASDAPEKDGATTDDAEATDEYENGVRVNITKFPMYCVRSGRTAGVCFDRLAQCAKTSKTCERRKAFACFTYTVRTDGSAQIICVATYGQCDRVSDWVNESREHTDVSECAIFRVGKKKKR